MVQPLSCNNYKMKCLRMKSDANSREKRNENMYIESGIPIFNSKAFSLQYCKQNFTIFLHSFSLMRSICVFQFEKQNDDMIGFQGLAMILIFIKNKAWIT